MRIRRPAVLFLGSLIIGVIIAYSQIPALFKLAICTIAIFLYGKLMLEGKLYARTFLVIVLMAIIGFMRFRSVESYFDRLSANVESLGKGNKIITGKIDSIGKSTNSNYLVLVNCYSEGLELGKCRCYFVETNDFPKIKIGNAVKVDAGTSIIDDPMNEGEFNQKNYYRSDGITFISFAKSVEVTNEKYDKLRQKIYEIKLIIKDQINKIFNEKDAGLFSAMITGDKSSIDKEQRKRFADNGIAHILAISGLHLSILGLALFELLRKKLSVNVAAVSVSIFILLYGIFIDAGPASLRAITMLFIRFLSLSIGRTYDSQNTLYIIAFIFILLRPYYLFNAGFQFSYVAIFALNHEVNIKTKNEKEIANIKKFDKVYKIPAVIVLTIFLFPITIFHYFTYPLYSIILNLIVIPLMAFVLGFGLMSLFVSFLYLPLGKIIAISVHVIFLIYDKLCEFIENLPAHLLVIGKPTLYELLYYFVTVFALIYLINNTELKIKSKKVLVKKNVTKLLKILVCFVLLVLAILVIGIRKQNDMRMTFVSIGQGDSILIESKDLILTIDGGSSSNTSNGQYVLSPHIKSRAIDHIDYAYITHADADHTNGIIYLLENEDEFKIKNLVLPITAMDNIKFDRLRLAAHRSGTEVSYMKEGDEKIFKDNFKLTVLNPNEESLKSKKQDQNEMSLTFRLDYNNHSALFTGDIGKETIGRMLKDNFALDNMDVEVLKVPHHGSKNSSVPKFFEKVSPKYSVFSYGKNNNYGHPHAETVDAVKNTGSAILKTGEKGQVDIYFDGEEITYKTYK